MCPELWLYCLNQHYFHRLLMLTSYPFNLLNDASVVDWVLIKCPCVSFHLPGSVLMGVTCNEPCSDYSLPDIVSPFRYSFIFFYSFLSFFWSDNGFAAFHQFAAAICSNVLCESCKTFHPRFSCRLGSKCGDIMSCVLSRPQSQVASRHRLNEFLKDKVVECNNTAWKWKSTSHYTICN